jgi:hypothetical protein
MACLPDLLDSNRIFLEQLERREIELRGEG